MAISLGQRRCRFSDEADLNRSTIAINRYWASRMGWVLLAVPLGYGGFLAWHEWVWHKSLNAVPVLAPLSSAPSTPAPEQFKPDAIASVLGLNTQVTWVQSAEPLQLRASFVSSGGTSQALLAGAQGAQFYAEGERLPSGSVLRRVEASHVVLWRNGREERLTLTPASKHVLPVPSTPGAAPPATSLHLRPVAEQP